MKSSNADSSKKVQISTKVTLNEEIEINVGFDVLCRIITELPCDYSSDLADVYNLCARSVSADVRESISRKNKLPENIVAIFAKDDFPDIIRNIIRDRDYQKLINDEHIEYILSLKNKDLDSIIASNFEDFTNCSTELILSNLIEHPDPSIRRDLAENSSLPMKIRNKLKKDSDPFVALRAKTEDCSCW